MGDVLNALRNKENYSCPRSCRLPLLSPSALVAFRCWLAVSLMAALLLPALTAQAGTYYWVTKDAQGNITAQSPSYSGGTYYGWGNNGPVTGFSTYGDKPTTSNNVAGWGGSGGGTQSPTASGQITVTFTWQPDPTLPVQPDLPPAHILAVEFSSAQATALNTSHGPPIPPGSPSCNDGIGPSAVMATSYVPNAINPSYSVTSGSCQDTRKTLLSGTSTVTLTCSPSASANGNASGCSASVFYSASIQADSRAVLLTRNGARALGKVYSPDGQLHGEYVDASGIGHGETTYSYLYGIQAAGASPTLTGNWQTFTATLLGSNWTQRPNGILLSTGTIPDVTWSWSPSESQDTCSTGICEMPQGGITYYGGGSSGKASASVVYPIGYAATDNGDHATATAGYALMVHEQWDNLRLDPTHPFDVIDNDVLVLVGGHQITEENDAASTPAPVGPISVAFTAGASLQAGLTGSFKLSDLFTLGGSFQASVSASGTVGQQITGQPIPPKSYIQLYFHTHYHKNHWLVDHYTPAGYDQTYTQIIDSTPDIAELHWGHSNSLPF